MAPKRTATVNPANASSRKKRRTSHSGREIPNERHTHEALEENAPLAVTDEPDATTAKVSNRNGKSSGHVRFDSEDAEAARPRTSQDDERIAPESPQPELQNDQEDSEDEVPDVISTSAAQKTSKAALANAAKAVSEQRTTQKRKRKELDARLKAQSKPTKKMRQSEEIQTDSGDGRAPSPDLLPAHLLEEDFSRQLTPSPPPRSARKAEEKLAKEASSMRKVLFRDPSPGPRDKQVGSVNVSVLQKTNLFLAPKPDAKVKSLREGWIRGRRGRGGIRLVERRLVNTGFVRH